MRQRLRTRNSYGRYVVQQWYCTIDGQRYGPVDESVLRQWLADRRVLPTDLVWHEGVAEWVQASAAPELAATAGVTPPAMPQAYLKPHRATTVLVLGIIGIVACFICGIIAWSMGNTDLREMDAGIMDPSGRDMTNAGKICGMISTLFLLAGLLLYCVFLGIFLPMSAR